MSTAVSVARRRAAPGSGSDLHGLLGEDRDMPRWWREAEISLTPYPHAVIGAVAANEYMPARQTLDIDLAIAVTDQAAVRAHLMLHGWRWTGALEMRPPLRGDAFVTAAGQPVDVIALPARFAPALAAAQRHRVDGMPMATLPWLVALKLHAGRMQDLADIGRMLGHQSAQMLAAVRHVVRASGATPEDMEDFEQVVALGRLEYGSGRRRARPRRRS